MLKTVEHVPFRGNPYFEQYVNLLLQLHFAMSDGNEDEAEDLREQMDLPGIHLNSKEIQWVKGLSADLYMLTDEEDFQPLDGSERQLILDIQAADDTSDGETMLRLLRKAYFTAPDSRAWFRSKAYAWLGYFSLSQIFLAFAAEKAPEHFQYKYILLAKFVEERHFDHARRLAMQYASDPNLHPMVRVLTAVTLYRVTENLPEDQASPFLRQGVNVIEPVPAQDLAPADALMKWMTLGACYFRLGNVEAAVAADTEAIKLSPSNDNSIEMRGRHRLRTDYGGALEDFQTAIRLGTALPYPYLFVIREHLMAENYKAAEEMSRFLIDRNPDPRVQAQANEFFAIALYGSGHPFIQVQQVYGEALRLAPSARRRKNFQDLAVADLGVIPRARILFPLLSVEEVEAFEDAINEEDAQSQSESGAARYNTSFSGFNMQYRSLSTINQKQITDQVFKADLSSTR